MTKRITRKHLQKTFDVSFDLLQRLDRICSDDTTSDKLRREADMARSSLRWMSHVLVDEMKIRSI